MTAGRAMVLYALASLVLIAALATALGLGFASPEEHRAIRTSAVTAYAVQLFAFAVARLLRPTNLLAGWALGMLVRLAVLAVFAIVMLKALALPAAAALVSLVTFFFVSTLVEPLLLKS